MARRYSCASAARASTTSAVFMGRTIFREYSKCQRAGWIHHRRPTTMRRSQGGLRMKGSWLVAVSLFASAAFAQQPGKYYVALDVGQSRIEAGNAGFFGPVTGVQHGNDVGFKASFGIQVSRFFAVE